MPDLAITSDKATYRVGETAELRVSMDWGEGGSGWNDPWAHVTDYVLVNGEPIRGEDYPDFGLHDGEPGGDVDWSRLAIAITNDTWGHHRVEAVIYEPERHEYGRVSVEFNVEKPEGATGESGVATSQLPAHSGHQGLPTEPPAS